MSKELKDRDIRMPSASGLRCAWNGYPENNTTSFRVGTETIVEIKREGLCYKGELVKDAGECYAAMMAFLDASKKGARKVLPQSDIKLVPGKGYGGYPKNNQPEVRSNY